MWYGAHTPRGVCRYPRSRAPGSENIFSGIRPLGNTEIPGGVENIPVFGGVCRYPRSRAPGTENIFSGVRPLGNTEIPGGVGNIPDFGGVGRIPHLKESQKCNNYLVGLLTNWGRARRRCAPITLQAFQEFIDILKLFTLLTINWVS